MYHSPLRDIKPAQLFHDDSRVTVLRRDHVLALAQAAVSGGVLGSKNKLHALVLTLFTQRIVVHPV